MAEDTPPPTTENPRPSGCWRLIGMMLLFILLIGGFLVWKFVDVAKEGLAWMGTNFVTQDINQTFRQSVTEIASNQGDILEVSTMQTDETVTNYDMKTLFNQTVYLGTTISEIRLPVVYRYHIKISEDWDLKVENGQCIVHAPALRPSLPPAIRTEGMEKKSEAGWLRFNAAENLAALEKNLTPTLEKRAGNRSHLNLVREASRKSVAEFVKTWLLKQDASTVDQVKSITVIFPDEIPANGQPRIMPPTVQVP
ncbi:hypothetical protein EI77_03793 [Prosthecobacter fusiformis]|uniref:DUF4230 domain-containing protein n=1 Tax=Prosthecobacter fusiformis TaxID=48464 RepID=A0A4R7RN92_9BACT|nr:hypothetical protein [Prosthecobacter fusiformis]TDU66056.1 hypothetical protein EI77_03793 [Prosthecobacter fusiformis]